MPVICQVPGIAHVYVSFYPIRTENYCSTHKNSCFQKFHVVRGKQIEITTAFLEVLSHYVLCVFKAPANIMGIHISTCE